MEEIFQRWEKAFGELDLVEIYKSSSQKFAYTRSFDRSLILRDRKTFPSDDPISTNPNDIPIDTRYEFGLRADGLPCYVGYNFKNQKAKSAGFFTYSDTLDEYVEFSLSMRAPLRICQTAYKDGKTILKTGMVGNSTRNISRPKVNPHDSLTFSYDVYTYDDQQNMDKIRRHFSTGGDNLVYSRPPEGQSWDALTSQLAKTIAQATIETLINHKVEQPLTSVILNYSYGEHYIPLLTHFSVRQREESIANRNSNCYDPASYLDVDYTAFEDLYAQFLHIAKEKDEPELGQELLYKTSKMLTQQKMFGRIEVCNDFLAFAMDPTFAPGMEELEEIYLACGLAPEWLEKWKGYGWFF